MHWAELGQSQFLIPPKLLLLRLGAPGFLSSHFMLFRLPLLLGLAVLRPLT